MNEYDVILELFNKFEDFSFYKNDIPEGVSSKDIANLIEKKMLEEELRPPSHCMSEGCSQPAETMVDGEKIIIRCSKNINHTAEAPKSDYTIYRMVISSGLLIILKKLLGDISSVSQWDDGDFCKVKLEKGGKPITFIFSMETIISEEKLFGILGPHILKKDFIVLIHKSTRDNYDNIDSILQKLSLGDVIFDLPLENIENEKIKKELEEWINYTGELSKLETKILDKIDDDDLRQLIASVDTNPKYILSALSRLKIRKARGFHDTKSWEEMERLITLIFHYMYTSDIKHGGSKQRGEPVTDNLFLVRDKDGIKLAGIVDSKCSMNADLSKEKTEKYENYFKKVRDSPWKVDKKALIFVVLNTKSEYTIKEFFGRLEKKLEKGEYVVILPLTSLERIIHSYLGVILRGRINLNKSDFNDLLTKIFDKDFLEKVGKIETNLYRLTPETILEELKKRAESPSSIETAFEEIFE